MIVATDQHPSTQHLPNPWIREDEWYEWVDDPEKQPLRVLLYVDESSYGGGSGHHPIAWDREYEGGRVFYTALGHTEASYADKNFREHLSGGIEWAAARSPNRLSSGGAAVSDFSTGGRRPTKRYSTPSL